jgi:hypothetical protein
MDYEVILNELKNNLSLEHPRNISQENLDKLIDYAIKNGNREIVWRIALSYSIFDLDFTKIMLYFIEVKDEFYVIETLYAAGDDKIDLKLTKKKVLETNDNEFIGKVIEDVKSYYCVKSNKDLNKIIEGGKDND